MKDEILIHQNQSELDDYLTDLSDTEIYKCKKCQWVESNKDLDFICLNKASDYYNDDVNRVKGCNQYFNDDEAFNVEVDEDSESMVF